MRHDVNLSDSINIDSITSTDVEDIASILMLNYRLTKDNALKEASKILKIKRLRLKNKERVLINT